MKYKSKFDMIQVTLRVRILFNNVSFEESSDRSQLSGDLLSLSTLGLVEVVSLLEEEEVSPHISLPARCRPGTVPPE